MKPGSLLPLSPEIRALLAVERELEPQPAPLRRRAELRARTAVWHERNRSGAGAGLLLMVRRFRYFAVAALVTSAAGAAWVAFTPPTAPEPAQKTAPPPLVEDKADEAPLRQRTPAKGAEPVEEEQAEAVVAQPKPAKVRPVAKRQTAGASEEYGLLDGARRAVAAGSYRTALAQLAHHQQVFPRSQLSEEREALRIRALRGVGQGRKAAEAASEFTSRYPNSVLAPQMKSRQESEK